MATGKDLLDLVETRLGEKYVNVLVPKNNPQWHGPWDCAELASWAVYQKVTKLYGCEDNSGNPATAEAYSGYWVRDSKDGTLNVTNQATANIIAGIILVRKPPVGKTMGHIAISDGRGGTVEAAGKGLGVRRGKIEGRLWHYCVKIPELIYSSSGVNVKPLALPFLLELRNPNMNGAIVESVQHALKDAGFNPGKIDGLYGPLTVAAVYAFQKSRRLVADGVVGPRTAKHLRINWPA